jgi:27-O-demethylrifamycin SV methyltransferase
VLTADPAAHYDAVAEAWAYLLGEDLHYGYFTDDDQPLAVATDALTDQMERMALLRAGTAVLDVGCGTGKSGCKIAAEYECAVTGISPSSVCIDNASALARSLKVQPQPDFRIGDGQALVFPDAIFDCVWVMESSHLIPDKITLLRECARVLKPDGRLVLCDIMLVRDLPLSEVIRHRDEFLLLQDVYGRAKMETIDFYREQMASDDLEVIHVDDLSAQTRPTFAHWRDNAIANQDVVSAMLGEQRWRQFLESCDVLERLWDESLLGYWLIAAVKPA